jgi:hypothetical protein
MMISSATRLETKSQPRRNSVTATPEDRLIVGIGDLHGHYQALDTLLNGLQEQYELFSDKDRKILKKGMRLVFTGDYIDRGENALQIIETLQELAVWNNHRLITLMGNHELLALEARDAAKKVIDELKLAPGMDAWWRYATLSLHGINGGNAFVNEFGPEPLLAFENFYSQTSKTGDIGMWIRNLLPAANLQIGDKKILFVHGDLSKNLKDKNSFDQYLQEYYRKISYPHPDVSCL